MVVAVLSSVVSAGYLVFSSTTEAARAGKLQSDVVTINNAIRTYLVHGGRIPATADSQAVLASLKSTADQSSGARIAGLRGTMLDARLRGIPATVPGTDRAVWNPAKQRFEIQTTGAGFSAFDLGADPAAPVAEEARARTLDLAATDKWVWDHADSSISRPVMREVFTANVAQFEPPPPPVITRLATPDVSLAGALYDYSAFSPNLAVSLIDPNPPGTARLFYSIENGPWVEYTGVPLSLPPQLTTRLRTYAAAVNGEDYEDSEPRTETYETIYFTGTSAGKFHTPVGDNLMATNLAAGQRSPNFKWGVPATADRKQNELNFTGSSFVRVAPDQEFQLGTLTYYNGTTRSNTNATGIQIAIDMDLTTPGVRESLNFTFRLLSTPNRGRNANEDADYVWIPDVSTTFRTTIKGKQFQLVLRFGEHSANGFTTIDTFHAHEGKLLTGTIYGRLSEVGVTP